MSDIAERLRAQQEAADSAEAAQREIDDEAFFEARSVHTVAGCAAVKIPFVAGLPTLAICKKPSKPHFKRFQDRVAEKDAGTAGAIKAAEELAPSVLVYPDAETFAKMADACPGVVIALGSAAAGLASAKAREDAKS